MIGPRPKIVKNISAQIISGIDLKMFKNKITILLIIKKLKLNKTTIITEIKKDINVLTIDIASVSKLAFIIFFRKLISSTLNTN